VIAMDRTRLFVASCVSLVTTAMVFAIRGDVAGDMAAAFHLTNEQLGLIFSPAFWCFTIAIFVSGALIDAVGMRALHVASAVGYAVGIALIVLAARPSAPVASIFDHAGTIMLYAGFMIMGLSQGLVEGVINPLIATVYNNRKTQRLNMLHAWWPGGMIVGGLVAVALTRLGARWEVKLATILVPAFVYLAMALALRYPKTERVQNEVPDRDMWREALRPGFVLLFCVMWLTAAIELGPDQWFPAVMQGLAPSMQGVMYLVYTAGLVFVLRTFASGVAHKSPVATLLVCSILAGLGLFWLGHLEPGVTSVGVALTAATVFGVGKSFLWPTMLGLTSERYPRGGALLMCLMGGAGMASVAIALPIMGARIDRFGPGAALQMMAALAIPLAIVFGGLLIAGAQRAARARLA